MPGVEAIRLHLADEILPLWHAAQTETRDDDAALPYWAFAWIGGLAIARHLEVNPEVVAGKTIFDLASGSGLCAIAAMLAGASHATAADIDPFAAAAIPLNARANGTRVSVIFERPDSALRMRGRSLTRSPTLPPLARRSDSASRISIRPCARRRRYESEFSMSLHSAFMARNSSIERTSSAAA